MKISSLSYDELTSQINNTTHNLYFLLDGARFEDVHHFLYSRFDLPEYFPLYHKTFYQTAMEVSPCLVSVDKRHQSLLQWYFESGADDNMALVMTASEQLESLGKHFQNYLEAKLPSMEIVLFRYYDPTVFDSLVRTDGQGAQKLLAPLSHVYWKHSQQFFCLSPTS